jgi:putative protease
MPPLARVRCRCRTARRSRVRREQCPRHFRARRASGGGNAISVPGSCQRRGAFVAEPGKSDYIAVVKKPELLAPGGSFQSAYQAFQAGADGVYLGMTEFSARKAAVNFTFDQLRRITGLARDRGKRIYVTVNTVVREGELEKLAETLFRLEAIGVDGVIVQDLGVLSILRRDFPSIPVHASTQMAVHNSAGIEVVKRLGVRRVILSRELPLARIRALREAHPDIELEVFIHGALCFSFSGICFASRVLTGRSGNRGDCAQICRSLFQTIEARDRGRPSPAAGSESPERSCSEMDMPARGHFFSCRDLFLGRDVLDLADAGVDAFKIEGRMKSPEYVFHAVRLYRRIIDDRNAVPEDELRELVRNAELTFSRRKTSGFLHSPSGERLLDADYPGHRGALLGTVQTIRGTDATVTLLGDLSVRDGLGFYPGGGTREAKAAGGASGRRRAGAAARGSIRGAGARRRPSAAGEPYIFSLRRIRRGGRDVQFARRGETVHIEIPPSPAGRLPVDGQEIYQFSSRFLDLPQPKEASFPLAKVAVDIEITLSARGGGFVMSVSAAPGSRAAIRDPAAAEDRPFSREVEVEKAAEEKPFAAVIEKLFAESGGSLFQPERIAFINESGMPDNGIFVPPSILKKVKNDFFRHHDSRFEASMNERVRRVAASKGAAPLKPRGLPPPRIDARALSRRQSLIWKGCAPIPFACLGEDGELPDLSRAPSLGGVVLVPLPPVILDEKPFLRVLTRMLGNNPRAAFAIGLSNVSHLAFAERLASLENAWFFVDFPLYAANHHAVEFFAHHVEKLLFQYSWIEGGPEDHAALAAASVPEAPLVPVDPSFAPPLFYGLGCIARHSMSDGACLEGCPKSFEADLRQGKNRFRLVVRDCVTYLFADETASRE